MYQKWGKRIIDIVLAILALIALTPLFMILIFLSAIFHKGKIWFVQKRIGRNEKTFTLIKFRTMYKPGFVKGQKFIDPVTHQQLLITPWGKFLRSFSLDEIPQFFNVIRGDLSWVGPRPLLPEYLPFYTQLERQRHLVKPGLTGLAQVNGKNDTTWSERLALDCEYVNKTSFKLDLIICFRTFMQFFEAQKHAMEISLADERKQYSGPDTGSYLNG